MTVLETNKERTMTRPDKILCVEPEAYFGTWIYRFGPLVYELRVGQPNLDAEAITWLYYDTSKGVRVAGRSVPCVGTIEHCCAAIERELLMIRAAIPTPNQACACGCGKPAESVGGLRDETGATGEVAALALEHYNETSEGGIATSECVRVRGLARKRIP